MSELFAGGVLSTFFPGRVYLKQNSASVLRAIGASNRPSLAANFFTATAHGDKCKTNIVHFHCHLWHRRTSLSTRELERVLHSSRRLTSELRATQRRHVSQLSSISSSTGDQPKTLTADSSPDSSKSEPLERFRKKLEPSSLPLNPDFDETLETSLKDVEEILPGLPENELIELLRAFADKLDEILYPPNDDAVRIRIWGKRLEELCQLLPSSPSEHSPKQALITRAQAMMNLLFPPIVYLNSIENWDDHNLHAAGTVLLAAACHQNLFRSLQLMIIETPRLSNFAHPYIDNIIQILLSRTPKVSAVIPKAVQENWPIEKMRQLGYFLLSNNGDPQLLGDIITKLQANNIGVNLSLDQILRKIENLLLTNDIRTAKKLYDSFPPSDDYRYIHTGIYLAARAGNSKHAQTLFDKLKAQGEVDEQDIKNLLLSYAEEGNVREVYRVFDEYFPKNNEGQRLNEPNVHHYSVVIFALARVADVDAVIDWLKDMERSELRFNDYYTFTFVIQALSKTNNLQGILDVFYKMRKLGAKPDVTVYTNLLRLYANRKDSEGAETLYKLAFEDGIVADLRMTQLLMNALTASGSLEGALRVFNYLMSQPTTICPPISVYNVVMKALVSLGAPFDVISKMFSKLKSMQLVDEYTYVLLVMSACDFGRLRTATNIYYEMVKEQANQSVSLTTVHILTMIMSAFLRQGNKDQAKEIYDHMIKRGIQPSRVTYGELVVSCVKEGTPESLRSAEEFIKSLVSDPKQDRNWAKDDPTWKPVYLYSHLLKFYGLQGNEDECERLYGEYLEGGGRPTVAVLSYVLEAYRKSI